MRPLNWIDTQIEGMAKALYRLASVPGQLTAFNQKLDQLLKGQQTIMATQAQFDADQKIEDADLGTLITNVGTIITAYQGLSSKPAVADLTAEDADAQAQDAAIKTAIGNITGILTPAPAAPVTPAPTDPTPTDPTAPATTPATA